MNMDREAKEYYEVIIQAKDMGGQLGGLAGTTTVNISLSDVNDNPPRFPQSKYCPWFVFCCPSTSQWISQFESTLLFVSYPVSMGYNLKISEMSYKDEIVLLFILHNKA